MVDTPGLASRGESGLGPARQGVENVLDIIEVVASAERKINLGNYESTGIFFSAKATVPRQADPTTISALLQSFVARQADLEEERIRHPELTLTGAPKPADSSSSPDKKDGASVSVGPKGEGADNPSGPKPVNNQPSGAIQEHQGASNGASGGSQSKDATTTNAKDDAPTCPKHGTHMKPSSKAGAKWYCNQRNKDGSWCHEKVV